MKEALLVFLGFFLGFAVDWIRRWRMRKAHWQMLGAEVSLCAERATWYIRRTVDAPLYRLPTSAFHVSFPVLVSEANLAANEFRSLIEYYSWAEDINRGLDDASDAAKGNDNIRLAKETQRLQAKCQELLSKYLEPALNTLHDHDVSVVPVPKPIAEPPG